MAKTVTEALSTASVSNHFSGKFIGGELCLDFANTADWHASDSPEEWLNGYIDLAVWGRQVGIFSLDEARRLLRQAAKQPAEATAALARALAFREAIYRIFAALAHGGRPQPADLDILNDILHQALGHLSVIPADDGFTWRWESKGRLLEGVLWPIAKSAADLLTSDDVDRVGQCADDRGCGWLFLDRSKNRSRRWCDMQDCGNRAKARRHYLRRRAQPSTAG